MVLWAETYLDMISDIIVNTFGIVVGIFHITIANIGCCFGRKISKLY